jgi:hypothetical protein
VYSLQTGLSTILQISYLWVMGVYGIL